MPIPEEDEAIIIPISQSVRAEVFYQMRLEEEMVGSGHVRAIALARQYYTAIQPVEFPPDVPLADIRAHTVFGTVRLVQIPVELAKNLTIRETRNRAHLEEYGSNQMRLLPVGSLDQRAWESFGGVRTLYSYADDYDETRQIQLSELDQLLTAYKDYALNHRMNLIRELVNLQLGQRTEDVNKKPVRSGTGKFDQFFRNFQNKLNVESDPLQYLTVLPHGTLSSRRWGIEIEAVDIAGIKTPKYWLLHGDGSLRSEPNRAMPDHLDACAVGRDPDCGHSREDGCTNDCDCGYEQSTTGQTSTGEWNSPVLRSFHSRGLEHICAELEGRQTNFSAGVHVHVEASDLTPAQAGEVVLLYSAFEPLFQAEYHRDSREYCQSLSSERVIDRVRKTRTHEKINGRGAVRSIQVDGRYYTVNLQSLASHGTIEFRAMGNVYEYEKLTKWAHFCREMVNMAKKGVPQKEWGKVKDFQGLVTLMSRYGKETPTPEWAPNQDAVSPVEQLGSEARRNPNQKQRDVGPADVFEDYTSREPVLTSTVR